jgi:predicted PhzF superfamily epimerase YddE/YHI9
VGGWWWVIVSSAASSAESVLPAASSTASSHLLELPVSSGVTIITATSTTVAVIVRSFARLLGVSIEDPSAGRRKCGTGYCCYRLEDRRRKW